MLSGLEATGVEWSGVARVRWCIGASDKCEDPKPPRFSPRIQNEPEKKKKKKNKMEYY
jgi:hypothetical protein